MSPQVIVFDYDGTLVASNAIKREAFSAIFAGQETVVSDVLRRNPSGTRWDTIRASLLESDARLATQTETLKVKVEELALQYDRIATEGAATCPERPGASEGLEWLKGKLPLYLLSATPQPSLECIVARRGWTTCFRAVRGVPAATKADVLKEFAAAENVHVRDVLMVGDSEIDRDAAYAAGTAYIHMEDGMTMQDLLCRLDCRPCAKETK